MKNLYRFYEDCGRMGDIEGLFIATPKEVSKLDGVNLYLGEVLGKHSDIDIDIDEHTIELISDDQDFVTKLEEVCRTTCISGFNPVELYKEQEEDY